VFSGITNPTHIAILALLAVLLFGAKRLPEVGRSLGTGMREFKESISGESPIVEPQSLPAAGTDRETAGS
jgi:sec-independent protein translocase protein TatA